TGVGAAAWVGYAWLPHLLTPLCARRGPRTGRRVALSFDDGPDPDWTARVLEILAKHDVSATFFLVGERAARAPASVRAIAGAGRSPGPPRAPPGARRRHRRPARCGGDARCARASLRGVARDDRRPASGGLRLRDRGRAARRLLTPPRQEAHELQSLAEPALHHRAIAQHLGTERDELARPEIEPAVERLDGLEDLRARQMRIAEHAGLRAASVH